MPNTNMRSFLNADVLPVMFGESVIVMQTAIANPSADADVSAQAIFAVPDGCKFTLCSAQVISQGSATIAGAETAKIDIKNGSDVACTKTFTASAAFPASGAAGSLGTPVAAKKVYTAGSVVTVDVTQSTSADLPAFIVQVTGFLSAA